MIVDDGSIAGDFSLNVEVGFNLDAYPLDEDRSLNWRGLFSRNLAVGLYQSDERYHIATIVRNQGRGKCDNRKRNKAFLSL